MNTIADHLRKIVHAMPAVFSVELASGEEQGRPLCSY